MKHLLQDIGIAVGLALIVFVVLCAIEAYFVVSS
jgi:hypothetical protein